MSQPHEHWIQEITARVGSPPRGMFSALRRHGRSKPPPWLKQSDIVSRIFANRGRILRNGHVRWAAIVHANNLLFMPGPIDSGAQVIYSPDEGLPLAAVREIAGRVFRLKETRPLDPAQRRIADMLTDERERALDWPIPKQLTGGQNAVTTVVILPRTFMPGGFIGLNHFPIVADLDSKMAILIPSRFWPDEMRKQGEAHTANVLSTMPLAKITPRAAAEIHRKPNGHNLVAEIRCRPKGKVFQFTFNLVPPGRLYAAQRVSNGVRVQIADTFTLARVSGTIVDHDGKRFVLKLPNAAS